MTYKLEQTDESKLVLPNDMEFVEDSACCAPPEPRNCDRCRRPTRVCLCSCLLESRLKTRGRVVILQHPFERKRRLATVPIITAALEGCVVASGRTFRPGKSKALDELVRDAVNGLCNLFVLFPGPDAANLAELMSGNWKRDATASQMEARQPEDTHPEYGLVVFDGTWREAKEMFTSSTDWFIQPNGPGIRVEVSQCSDERRDKAWRKEPLEGCMSTVEAVARALRYLEANGQEIEALLMKPLCKMVEIQGTYNEVIQARSNGTAPIVSSTKKRMGMRALP